jgi:hypothetical protein
LPRRRRPLRLSTSDGEQHADRPAEGRLTACADNFSHVGLHNLTFRRRRCCTSPPVISCNEVTQLPA